MLAIHKLADAYRVDPVLKAHSGGGYYSSNFDYFDNVLAITWHRISARNCHTPSQEFLDSTYFRLNTAFGTGWWANGAVDDIQKNFPKAIFGNCTE